MNEERFLAEIQPYGFRKIYMEDLPLLDQIRTAAEAECIIGPHGAGMTASMFMKPRGRVIEIFASAYINPCVLGVCASLGHDYALVVNRQWTNPYPHGDAVFVEMDTLRAALKPLGKR